MAAVVDFKQHSVYIKTYKTPEYCFLCKKLLVGLYNQGVKCETCAKSFHKECYLKIECNKPTVEKNMNNKKNDGAYNFGEWMNNIKFKEVTRDLNKLERNFKCDACEKIIKGNCHYESLDGNYLIHLKCKNEVILNEDDNDNDNVVATTTSVESVEIQRKKFDRMNNKSKKYLAEKKSENEKKKTRMSTKEHFYEGRIMYSIDDGNEIFVDYWQLDKNLILIYKDNTKESITHVIPLSSIQRVIYEKGETNKVVYRSMKQSKYACKFHLVTEEKSFHVGVFDVNQRKSSLETSSNFYDIFKFVYLPYDKSIKKSIKITAPKYEDKNIFDEYEIDFMKEIGRGTFGTVYSGFNRETKQNVAIKRINTNLLDGDDDNDENKALYQSEISIQLNLDHPGLVKLLALFHTDSFMFIVMERLNMDLLERIIDKTKLSETETKFIGYQILSALNFMHGMQIGHCDLKPENILLAEDIELPYVKICDFGHSRIIGPNSIRKTRVGTSAYNRIILYVCLTGCAPFVVDKEIRDQKYDLNFLFITDIWKDFDKNVKDLIKNELLVLQINRRTRVPKIMKNIWFTSDIQLLINLQDLEKRINKNWISQTLHEHWPVYVATLT